MEGELGGREGRWTEAGELGQREGRGARSQLQAHLPRPGGPVDTAPARSPGGVHPEMTVSLFIHLFIHL